MKTLITGYHSDVAQALLKRRQAFGDAVTLTTSSDLGKTPADGDSRVVHFDLSDPEGLHHELDATIENGVDILILNAAGRMTNLKPLHELPFPDLSQYLRTNVEGNLWLIQKVLPGMQARGFGRILFISSISSSAGTSNYGIYCAAKAAIEGLIFNISVDYGEFGIYANVLRPGILATERTKDFWSRPGYQKVMGKTIPAGKIGTAEQVAEASDSLLSATTYINGAVLDVGGGLPRIKSRTLT